MSPPEENPRSHKLAGAGAALGLTVLIALLLTYARPAEVVAALAGGGWPLLAASVYRIVPLALNGAGWRALIWPGPPSWRTTLRLRWIGEAVNALLPAAQIGGDFARARLLTAGGVPGAEATAAMVADVTVGAVTQVVFTFLGAAALIVYARPGAAARMHLGWLALVIGVGLATAALLLVVARVGVGRLLNALPLHLSGRLAARLSAGGATIDRALGRVRRRPRALAVSSGWHIAAWLAQVVETWLVLKLLGRPVSWAAALAIESLAASARGAAFVVPGGIGVQEGALVAVGAAFGVADGDRAGARDHQARARAAGRRARDRRLGDCRAARHRQVLEEETHGRATADRAASHLAQPGDRGAAAASAGRRAGRSALEPDGGRPRQDLGAAGGGRGGRRPSPTPGSI